MSLPDLPPDFRWTQEPFGPALRCIPLEAIAPHLFTTRQLALSSEEDWGRVAAAVGAERVQTLTQVHGREVVVVSSPEGLRHTDGGLRRTEGLRHTDEGLRHTDGGLRRTDEGLRRTDEGRHRTDEGRHRTDERLHNGNDVAQRFSAASRPEADVLVSNDPRVAIAVRAADCVPLLIADPKTGTVAAVHAGWRGTAVAAAAAGVQALEREFGARPADLVAAIGPSIGACCYEVGSDVVDAFAAAGHARYTIDRWFVAKPRETKLRFDTAGANRDQLILAGLKAQNVHVSGLCTAGHLDLFPSYRAEKANAGRIAGVIRAI